MSKKNSLKDGFLPGLPVDRIRARYAAAPGREIESGNFLSPESSAALAANAFGLFLDKPEILPPLPVQADLGWPPLDVTPEVEARFPFRGGTHPWLDVMINTRTSLIGVESKRYEPFRARGRPKFTEAHYRPVWGDAMTDFCRMRDELASGSIQFERLDAAQLVKHAFGLRTSVHPSREAFGRRPVLVYLYAEPASWPNGKAIPLETHASHRREIDVFAERVAGDEVRFVSLSYRQLLDAWREADNVTVRSHAAAIEAAFAP